MMQWLASGVVILGCGYIGLVLASMMDLRIRQMEEMENVFQQLAFNVGFLSMTFAQAVCQASRTQRGAVAELFAKMAEEMKNHPQQPLRNIFLQAKERTQGLYLKEPELDTVLEFLSQAGKGGRQEMLDGIHLTMAKLKTQRETAIAKRERDGKMCRGLGFLTGMLIVVVLL